MKNYRQKAILKLEDYADSFISSWKAWRFFRVAFLWASLLLLGNLLTINLLEQIDGKIIATHAISFFHRSWDLPFSISRGWDPFLFPIFIILIMHAFDVIDDQEFDSQLYNVDHQAVHSIFLDLHIFGLIGGYACGMFFGVIYVIPCYLISALVAFFAGIICIICLSVFSPKDSA